MLFGTAMPRSTADVALPPRSQTCAKGCRHAQQRPVPDSIHLCWRLDTQVQYVKGIGPQIAETLAAKGISTVEDLLYHLPFRYEDRLHPDALSELKPGEMASVIGEVRGTVLLRTRRMPIFEMTVGQGISSLKCMWFHGTYLKDKFKPGQMLAVYGKVEPSRSGAASR